MTMARVKDGEIVEVGIPSRLSESTQDDLRRDGWRPIKGKPKPDNPSQGMRYVYNKPYTYNANEDAVYGTWVEKDVPGMMLKIKREKAVLPRADFKLALREMGELSNIKTMMDDPATPERVLILWENATEFHRMNEDFLAMGASMNYTETQMDQLFGITT